MKADFDHELALRQQVGLLLELHELTCLGMSQSAVANLVRDRMEETEAALSDPEQEFLRGLSEDLYSISDYLSGTEIARPPKPQLQVAELNSFFDHHDFTRALAAMREFEFGLTAAEIAFRRGRAYDQLGFEEIGRLFAEHASRLAPRNVLLQIYALRAMAKGPRVLQVRAHARELLQHSETHAMLVVTAAEILVRDSDLEVQRRVATALEPIVADEEAELIPSFFTLGSFILSICHRSLGDHDAAFRVLTNALRRQPDNGLLWAARGLVGADSESERSLADFAEAVQRRAPIPAPYLILAASSFRRREFAKVIELSEEGLRYTHDSLLRAEVLQWLAFVASEAGNPKQALDYLSAAQLFDPLNTQIEAGQQRLRELLAGTTFAVSASGAVAQSSSSFQIAETLVRRVREAAARDLLALAA